MNIRSEERHVQDIDKTSGYRYVSSVWGSYRIEDIQDVEKVQRCLAARRVSEKMTWLKKVTHPKGKDEHASERTCIMVQELGQPYSQTGIDWE